jgi:hypothetical protein
MTTTQYTAAIRVGPLRDLPGAPTKPTKAKPHATKTSGYANEPQPCRSTAAVSEASRHDDNRHSSREYRD